MLNRCVLIGRLVADPELRYTQTGIAVTNFRIAVDRPFS
ncbi:MAG TPA: single-stranded DNA-binding protein, partial [Limnochordia bacterium]|nr:single-stranded DNA-binding protein [Limnochordia bacterium]